MRIDERTPCPRCGHPRVVQRTRAAYLCFQCHFAWTVDPAVVRPMCFSAEELARLIVYRDAIRAGLYSDW